MEELLALKARLEAERAKIVEEAAPFHHEYDRLQVIVRALDAKARQQADMFKAIERPRLGEIDQKISVIARALGGKTINADAEQSQG